MVKRTIGFLTILLMFCSLAWGQSGSILSDLTEDTAPAGDSLLYTVDDPAGTPVDRKVTKANLLGTQTKSFALDTPTASDDFLLWRTPVAITITNIYGVLQSGTNVVGGLDECDSNGANPTPVDTDIAFDGLLDQDDGSLSNPTIDAGDWVKWHTTSVSSPGWLTITIYFTID
jgi:hypothetical protein